MSSKFEQLTNEQIELIPEHCNKWFNLAISTERIDREQAEKTVNSAYEIFGQELPTILFFDSPYAACNFIAGQTDQQLLKLCGKTAEMDSILGHCYYTYKDIIRSQVDLAKIKIQANQSGFVQQFERLKCDNELLRWGALDYHVGKYIWEQFDEQSQLKIKRFLGGKLHKDTRREKLYRYARPGILIADLVCQLDYFISIFDLVIPADKWQAFKSLMGFGNYIFFNAKACFICDRPIKMSFDFNYYLHAEGELAIKFADGTGLYSHHGTTLPTKYGKLHPKQWQTKWLLEENNPLLKIALVEGIGYVRLSNELAVTEVDCWRNYLLISIDISLNSQLFYLLRINIYNAEIERAMEIPYDCPTVQQAAESICFWEIETEDFEELKIPF
jgi:hypothetical protein